MSREEFDEVFVRKHYKFRNEFGSLQFTVRRQLSAYGSPETGKDTPVGMCFDRVRAWESVSVCLPRPEALEISVCDQQGGGCKFPAKTVRL